MNNPITEAVEKALRDNASMAMLIAARPDVAAIVQQAFRVGFADGALWQSVAMLKAHESLKVAA